jgi:predicted PurR-regulated permease PerM
MKKPTTENGADSGSSKSQVSQERVLSDLDASLLVQAGLLGLAILYTLYFARFLLVPLTAALLLHQLLYSPVQWLHRKGLPLGMAAGLMLSGVLFLIGLAGNFLAEPAEAWLRDAPASLHELSVRLRETAGTGAIEELRELGEEVEGLISVHEADASTQVVRIEGPGLLGNLAVGLEVAAAGLVIMFFTCFFLLSGGNRLSRALVALGSTADSRRRISMTLRDVRKEVSTYLNTVTMINIGLGLVVGLMLWTLGVPDPALWGVMVALFNFAPYIGAIGSAFVLTVVGVTAFDTLGQALLVPALFLGLTTIEGSLVTPMILGRRVSLNSLLVFLSVVFWGWIWGPAGALMAVPVTSSLSVFWAHFKRARMSAEVAEAAPSGGGGASP